MKQRAFVRGNRSGRIAKERLRQMKIAEQTDCSMEDLELMKAELATVISKYIEIGKRDIHLYLKHGKRATVLAAAVSLPSAGRQETAEIIRKSS